MTDLYSSETVVGRQVACVVNLSARWIGPFLPEVLTLGFPDAEGRVVLVAPERPVPNGAHACSDSSTAGRGRCPPTY